MADRYWVGGTGTWNATAGTKWSTTSNGAGGAAVPTASDDVFLNGASGAVTVTISGTRVCRSLNCTGFTGTLDGGGALNIGTTSGGGLTLVSGMTMSHIGTISFVSTSSHNVTTGGKTIQAMTVNGSGVTVTLQDALTLTGTMTVTQGTLNTNGQTCTIGALSSNNSNTRTISLGASTVTITSSSTNALTFATETNLTFTAGTSTVKLTGTATIDGNTRTFYNVELGGTGTVITAGAFTVSNNFILSGSGSRLINSNITVNNFDASTTSASITDAGTISCSGNFTVGSSATYSATGAITFTSTSTGKTITTSGETMPAMTFNGVGGGWTLQDSLTLGSTKDITLTNGTFATGNYAVNARSFQSSNSNVRTITFGSSTLTMSANFTTSSLAAFDFTTSTNLTVTANTATLTCSGVDGKFTTGAGTFSNLNMNGGAAAAQSCGAVGGTFTGTVTFKKNGQTGSYVFGTLTAATLVADPATSFVIPASNTITITTSMDGFSGTAGNRIVVISGAGGSTGAFSKSSGTVSCDYLDLLDCQATGGATFYAGANSVNNGNNPGWTFTAPPGGSVNSNMFMFF
jgi:hypothetical protein